MSYIYLSYSRRNQDEFDRMVKRLKKTGFSVWEGEPGNSAIDGCAAFMVLMTSQARENLEIYREWQYALDHGKPVLPVLLEGTVFLNFRKAPFFDMRKRKTLTDDMQVQLRDALLGDTRPVPAAAIAEIDKNTADLIDTALARPAVNTGALPQTTILGKSKELQDLRAAMRKGFGSNNRPDEESKRKK